ncbi:GNAT family N-acetyltransferase [Ensifer sp. MJa1]|uniref:GNAT family N-acetyltransferase n=1 Tax=Ensifer sp. MJa1 TaxID=2919888 RepID=UPI003009816A
MLIETERLRLRPWEERDVAPFAVANADPEVRRYYYPAILTADETQAMIVDCDRHLSEHGFGFVAVERKSDGALIGGLGLSRVGEEIPGGPHVEIGWILARPHWRQGYALEAASACLHHGWETLGLVEIIGYTSGINHPSRALMEKLGMRSDPAEDFDDITVPEGNPLRPHVLYRIKAPASAPLSSGSR